MIRFLEQLRSFLTLEQWLAVIEAGDLQREGEKLTAQTILRAGDCLVHRIPDTVEPTVNADLRVVFEDAELFIVDKPAPLPVHPSGRFNKNTALFLLEQAFPEQCLRPVHRLDANTTGMLIFAKTRVAARAMALQFEKRSIEKTYLARVLGHPRDDAFCCDLPIQKYPNRGGSRAVTPNGLAAMTRFSVLSRFADDTSLLKARPQSGRTHQIRLHLKELGHPVVGDSVYGKAWDLSQGFCHQQKICLHAWMMRFVHPRTEQTIGLSTDRPAWTA